MSARTCSNSWPRVSTRSVVSAQYMKASSGSGLWPTRICKAADASNGCLVRRRGTVRSRQEDEGSDRRARQSHQRPQERRLGQRATLADEVAATDDVPAAVTVD